MHRGNQGHDLISGPYQRTRFGGHLLMTRKSITGHPRFESINYRISVTETSPLGGFHTLPAFVRGGWAAIQTIATARREMLSPFCNASHPGVTDPIRTRVLTAQRLITGNFVRHGSERGEHNPLAWFLKFGGW